MSNEVSFYFHHREHAGSLSTGSAMNKLARLMNLKKWELRAHSGTKRQWSEAGIASPISGKVTLQAPDLSDEALGDIGGDISCPATGDLAAIAAVDMKKPRTPLRAGASSVRLGTYD